MTRSLVVFVQNSKEKSEKERNIRRENTDKKRLVQWKDKEERKRERDRIKERKKERKKQRKKETKKKDGE